MTKNLLKLNELPKGSLGKVKQINANGSIRRRMLDLGLIHHTTIKTLVKSPAGDPIAYEIRGATIALRSEEASQILVKLI